MSDSGSDESTPLAEAVYVGKCNVHRAQDRYGEEARDAHRTREHRSAYVLGAGFPSHTEWPWVDEENASAEPTGAHIFQEMPDVQLWRMNLTALSHSFPLYFGAFQGRIFAYTISTAMMNGQFIQQFPDIQLVTQPTSKGREIGGTIDQEKGHIINHITTGFLGDQEIVAAAFDNGDVLAYSVPAVWAEIERRSKDPAPKRPQPHALTAPFFHDNVCDSAWGLAIHKQSGLLAVSTNRHEVTVFAFAETQTPSAGVCEGCEDGIEDQVRRRARLWRIVIGFGPEANNLPNIAFIDDEDGEATAVCAMDIDGETWISPIWTHTKSVYALSTKTQGAWDKRGWGVLPLPHEAFMIVTNSQDLLGGMDINSDPDEASDDVDMKMPLQQEIPRIYDSQFNVLKVPDNPCLQELKDQITLHLNNCLRSLQVQAAVHRSLGMVARDLATALAEGNWSDLLFRYRQLASRNDQRSMGPRRGQVAEDEENDEEDEDGDLASATSSQLASMFHGEMQAEGEEMTLDGPTEESILKDGDGHDESGLLRSRCCGADYQVSENSSILLPMTYIPSEQRITRDVSEAQAVGQGLLVRRNQLARSLWKRYRFLTTYIDSLALLAPSPHSVAEDDPGHVEIHFSKVIGPYAALSMHTLEGFRFHPGMRRLNMLHFVPDLSLLVIGSSTGRVVIVTPTRMAQRDKTRRDWDFGFRVEAILPRASDEATYGLERQPLHGIAVGPLYYGEEQPLEKRYLLTMHFRNHDIVTYELGRDTHRDRTVIF